jgi:hypothetical protein
VPTKSGPLEPSRLRVEQEQNKLQCIRQPDVQQVGRLGQRDPRVAGVERTAEAAIGGIDSALLALAARAVERRRYAPDELVFATARGTPLHPSNFNRRTDLPGLHTQGDTLDEATANAEEALALYIEGLREEGRPIGAGVLRRKLPLPA